MDNIIELKKVNKIYGKEIKDIRKTGFYSISHIELNREIENALSEGILKGNESVIELGSGLGLSSLVWAANGFNINGMEIDQELYSQSQIMLADLSHQKVLNGEAIKLVQGSYFPIEYIEFRKKHATKTLTLENDFSYTRLARNNEVFFPIQNNPELYNDKFGKNYSDFDITYAYIWDLQTPSTLEMFALLSKKEAILAGKFAIETKDLKNMIKYFGLEIINETKFRHPDSEFYFIRKKENSYKEQFKKKETLTSKIKSLIFQ